MKRGKNDPRLKRCFSLAATTLMVLSTLFVGMIFEVPNASAVTSKDHTVGNLDVKGVTDIGRISNPVEWGGELQMMRDPMTGQAWISLVVDHDGYDHTPGAEDIAEGFQASGWPYANPDDFTIVTGTKWLINTPDTQKSFAAYQNTGTGMDANDILINQTVWTALDKDWAIVQYHVLNLKATDITGFCLGLELPLSQEGTSSNSGVGGDHMDDVDGYDAVNDIYWAQDDSGVTIGFGSAIPSHPINHYYSEDYHAVYGSGFGDSDPTHFQNFFKNDTWLYERLHAPNAVEGAGTQGNRSATVGWNGETILAGKSKTFTLVIAVNSTQADMTTAVLDAQYYYYNVASGFRLTEFSDDSTTQRVEVYNYGRAPTDMAAEGYYLSLDDGATAIPGSWAGVVETYGHIVFDVTGQPIPEEGGTIGLYQDLGGSYVLVDGPFSYGLEGRIPDPLDGESVSRWFDSNSVLYTDEWGRDPTPTWGIQNDRGKVVSSPVVVINRVMYDPIDPQEYYVEIYWRNYTWNLDNYTIVCDAEYVIPPGTSVSASNPSYVLTYNTDSTIFDGGADNMDATGDNIYLYNSAGELLDMVGWSSAHTQGYYMTRSPDAGGTYNGFNDTTSMAAGWVFDQQPNMLLTEISVDDPNTPMIEVYNPRGGDKVPTGWSLQVGGIDMIGTWSFNPIPSGGYSTFTRTGGNTVNMEGDTFSLNFLAAPALVDEVGFGTAGPAPDPLMGGSVGRYWDSGAMAYTGDWNKNHTTVPPTWDAQNNVPAVIVGPGCILQEVMFNPSVIPDGYFIVIINAGPFVVDITDWAIVVDEVYQFNTTWSSFLIPPANIFILRYNDQADYQPMLASMDATGDNAYLYNGIGERIDMVGWNTAHNEGMSVKRVPLGNGTFDGYDDTTSEAAGWVFNTPLDVYFTEISDEGGTSQIEIYNFYYPTIDFDAIGAGYSFEHSTGVLTGTWLDSTAGAGEYAVFNADAGQLQADGDTITLIQNGITVEEAGYGLFGTVPDPLDGESVQRIFDGNVFGDYLDVWGRNISTGTNFGSQNDVPDHNLSSAIILNEVMFNPTADGDHFIELYNTGGAAINISGWKIVGDREYIIPDGTVLDLNERYFYLLYGMPGGSTFFDSLWFNKAGDNIYLYNQDGSIVDMVGWSSLHTIDMTMTRFPDGNGTRDGYDNTSSVAAGWMFNQPPTVKLILVDTMDLGDGNQQSTIQYGHFGSTFVYNLTITNLQGFGDTIQILDFSQEGWTVEIYDENGTFIISEIFVNADGTVNFTVNITLPDTFPFAVMDNITILVRSTNSTIIGDSILLNMRVYPFLNLTKSVSPDEIYMNGTGHDEIATLTLNMTGMGAQVAQRRYLDTVFCIDSSGSMQTTDLYNERITASQAFVADRFENPDRGAVVEFDVDARLIPLGWPTGDHLSSDYADIIFNLGQVGNTGTQTFISPGLNMSNRELRPVPAGYGDPTHVPVIILITDAGLTNQADADACIDEANISASHGIVIFTIGLMIAPGGPGEQLLIELANITGGMYFPAPDASHFTAIYENISSYLTDLAVWDNNTNDPNPLVRDVLPPYIDLVGNFWCSEAGYENPSLIYVDNVTGETVIEWDLPWVKLGQTVTFTFDIKSNVPGYVETNVYTKSRANYTRWDDSEDSVLFPETWVTVLPPSPMPPNLYIDFIDPLKNDIHLYWDQPIIPGTEYYLIYRSTTPDGFDFTTPWKNTNVSWDGGIIPKRLEFNDTGAVDGAEQYYYCLRSVNGLGEISYSSRTVGKWTRTFAGGTNTFSLPLEPLTPQDTEFYAQDMNAMHIKWMNTTTHTWMQHDAGEAGDNTIMEVGKGYEVDFAGITRYTFLGMPGGMIRYKADSTVGFDPATEAGSLEASVNAAGDVQLQWIQPASMASEGQYHIYRSFTRDGFHGTRSIDYTLEGINFFSNTLFLDPDSGVALANPEVYYMIIPVNGTGVEGGSTYSIGIWTANILPEYDTLAIPLQLTNGDQTADWYCNFIDDTVGINYFMYSDLRWGWHSERMPGGAFDPVLVMTEGYQISASAGTRCSFVGR